MASLKFLQISDLHLDSSLQAGRLSLSADKARARRLELRQILPKACGLVRDRGLEAVLVPGDLFDDDSVTQDTVNYVIDHLAGLAPVPVVISPGNHDFYSLGSPYNNDLLAARKQRPWPVNVHIFTSGDWTSFTSPALPNVVFTGIAHCANAALDARLLSAPVPRPPARDGIAMLVFHGSRDNTKLPGKKLRTLPFSDGELAAQGFDYAAIGHYHDHAEIRDTRGRVIGAYSGCPVGRGLDEIGERFVLVGEIHKDETACSVAIEKLRLDRRAVRRVDVPCTGATHREAILKRVEEALSASAAEPDDLVQVRLEGRVAPGIDLRLSDAGFEERYFHLAFDTTLLKPDYDLERYRDQTLRTTEARFAREMLRRIESEQDAARRLLLENALYYGLDALLQKQVAPRYEDASR